MPATKEHIRRIITDNNLNSVADVYTLLKDSFTDSRIYCRSSWMQNWMLSRLWKKRKENCVISNKRNEHTPKKIKSQYGKILIDVPRDRDGAFEPKTYSEIPEGYFWNRGKGALLLCKRYEHKGYPWPDTGVLRDGAVCWNGQRAHWPDATGNQEIAVATIKFCLSVCIYGLHPL